MLQRLLCVLMLAVTGAAADVPAPHEALGFDPGADYKLASYEEITSYFQKLAAASDRIRLVEYGKTSLGRPSFAAFISSPENLRNLDRLKAINRRLVLGEPGSVEDAAALAREGKVFVWIDSGLHATEVAPAQHSPELAWRMVAGESDEIRRIRDKVVLIQIPCINPDGLDMVVEWYRKNIGTPFEIAPLPALYQKYAGHDNNRDWYMMNLQETRNVSRLLFAEWFPQIVYNQHQAPPFPARIFIPPYAEPLNPNIPAAVMEGINLIGSAMKERFAREGKTGILSYYGFDAWWNGGLRSVPAFHNMHGILTETALHAFATPRMYKPSEFPERFGNGMPTKEPGVFYERPWMGGRWGTREAIEYMLTADFAILDLASTRAESFLIKSWQMARDNIESGKRGNPWAYIIPQQQWDKFSATEMLRRLQMAGLAVSRAKNRFTVSKRSYDAGTYILLAAQPFRPYLIDLMEPQKYPEIKTGITGPTRRPYDVAGWTLPMQMGVVVERLDDIANIPLEVAGPISSDTHVLDNRDTGSFHLLANELAGGSNVRWASDGRLLRAADAGYGKGVWQLSRPRAGVYQPWIPNSDAGWTDWLLDEFQIEHQDLRNADIAQGGLRSRFDAVIIADQTLPSILHGWKAGEYLPRRPGENPSQQRPEYSGGIGLAGAAALETFVRDGGTLIVFNDACELPVQLFGLPVRLSIRRPSGDTAEDAGGGYFSPGSILRVTTNPAHPIAFGMPKEAYAFQNGGQAWDITLLPDYNHGERALTSIAKYGTEHVLASGWLSGERFVAGKNILIEARLGQGRVVLFGFRPQFRGQSFGTFRLVLNALYLSAAKPVS